MVLERFKAKLGCDIEVFSLGGLRLSKAAAKSKSRRVIPEICLGDLDVFVADCTLSGAS